MNLKQSLLGALRPDVRCEPVIIMITARMQLTVLDRARSRSLGPRPKTVQEVVPEIRCVRYHSPHERQELPHRQEE